MTSLPFSGLTVGPGVYTDVEMKRFELKPGARVTIEGETVTGQWVRITYHGLQADARSGVGDVVVTEHHDINHRMDHLTVPDTTQRLIIDAELLPADNDGSLYTIEIEVD